MSQPDFLVHDKADNVGVIVVETVEAGKQLSGLIMETGFYDRLLPSISGQRCGVAFDHQWVESVPHEPLDQKMDWIITPHRWVKARKDV